jgi:hypothetical protein
MPPIRTIFILLLLGGAVCYGLMPAVFPMIAILGMLWLLVSFPMLAIALAVLWVLRWLVADFFIALIGGFGAGLGARASGVFDSPERAERRRERWEDRRRRY